jgi:hypothetical protein
MGKVADALALYRTFNAREPDFVSAVDVCLPDRLADAGYARQILYRSNKWRTDGVASDYLHRYESAVRCLVRWEDGLPPVLIKAWPRELVHLGFCLDLEVETAEGTVRYGNLPNDTLLCATPDGQSLVLLHLEHGILGALTGGRQRITDRGIEG